MLAERNYLVFAIAVAILIRIAVEIGTAHSPIPNEQGIPVSPLHAATSSDLVFYQQSRELYFSGGIDDVLNSFARFYSASTETRYGLIISAPIFPALLLLFDYGPGHTLPLALFFLVLSAIMVAAWLRWFHARSLPLIWLLAFAVLPHSIWFTLNVGSDFLAALFFTGFYISYFGTGAEPRRLLLSLLFVALLLLTRPNGVSIFLFLIIDQLFFNENLGANRRYWLIAASAVASAPFLVFYFPYLFQFVSSTLHLTYFGVPETEYLAGIYDSLPHWLNLLLSWLSLAGAKILYLVGLRPSYAGTETYFVLLRALSGLIFLPGLIYLFIKGDRSHKLLLALFLLPIVAGASQDRYILPIQPVLFLFGAWAYISLWRSIIQRSWFRSA